jgi:hypothetical protein
MLTLLAPLLISAALGPSRKSAALQGDGRYRAYRVADRAAPMSLNRSCCKIAICVARLQHRRTCKPTISGHIEGGSSFVYDGRPAECRLRAHSERIDVSTCGFRGTAWRIALSALMTGVLALAPLAAQVVMSSRAHAAPHGAAGHSHDNGHGHNQDHAAHSHAHSHHHDGDQPAGHHHDGPVADHGTAPSSSGHHDHGGGNDTGCCGAFCHSTFFLTVLPQMPGFAVGLSFAGVEPGQPQRPPSRLLSL